MTRKQLLHQIIEQADMYGVVVICDDFILRKMLERMEYQVFEDSWMGYAWYAAVPEFDIEKWGVVFEDGTFWAGGEKRPE